MFSIRSDIVTVRARSCTEIGDLKRSLCVSDFFGRSLVILTLSVALFVFTTRKNNST